MTLSKDQPGIHTSSQTQVQLFCHYQLCLKKISEFKTKKTVFSTFFSSYNKMLKREQ